MNEEETNSLPESIRDWPEVKESKDITSFWNRMTHMRSKFGTGIFKPGEDAGSEDWGKFSNRAVELSEGRLMPKPDLDDPEQRKALNKALGVPDDVKDYEFGDVEGSTLDDGRKEFISAIAKEANLTKAQLKILDTKYREKDVELFNVQKSQFDDDLKALNQEWGLAVDDRINFAKKVQKAFFPHLPDDLPLAANELKAFYSLYKQLNNTSTEFQEQEHQQSSGMSPDEAVIKIAEMRNNPKHPYNNRHDPGHETAKKKMRSLYLTKNNMQQ